MNADTLFLPLWTVGLSVVDVRPPDSPEELLLWKDEKIFAPVGLPPKSAAWQDHLYLTLGVDGVAVLDVADPTQPTVVARIAPTQFDEMNIVDAATYDRYLYLLTRHWDRSRDEFSLFIFDLIQPAEPVKVLTLEVSSADQLAIGGDYAYLSGGLCQADNQTDELTRIDIFDPTKAAVAGQIPVPCPVYDLAIDANHAALSIGEGGLMLMDLSDPLANPIIGEIDLPGLETRVVIDQDFIYLVDEPNGFYVLQIHWL